MEEPRRRPALRASWETTGRAPSAADDPGVRRDMAHATAAALLEAGRSGGCSPDRLVGLVDHIGLEDIAELWRDAGPETLPGALWRLYLLRTWCREQGGPAARLYRAGRAVAAVADVVAGVAEPPGPAEMADLGDAVLSGVYRGDLGVALDRAAAFCRVIAAGRGLCAEEPATERAEVRLAAGNLRAADQLERAAAAWRAGALD